MPSIARPVLPPTPDFVPLTIADALLECLATFVEAQIDVINAWWTRWDGLYSDSLHLFRRPAQEQRAWAVTDAYTEQLDTVAHLARLVAGEFGPPQPWPPVFVPLQDFRIPEAWVTAERALWADLVAACDEEEVAV